MTPFKTDVFVPMVLKHCEAEFPKTCNTCTRHYASFSDYVRVVTPVGCPVCYDEAGNLKADFDPLGTLSYANCPCGSTVSMSCDTLGGDHYLEFVASLRADAKAHGLSLSQVLVRLRALVWARAAGVEYGKRSLRRGSKTTSGQTDDTNRARKRGLASVQDPANARSVVSSKTDKAL